jgi:hypothetical protein
MAVGVNVTGSFNSAGLNTGLVPGGVPHGATSPVAIRPVVDIAGTLAAVAAADAIDELRSNLLAIGVETPYRKGM